MLIIAPRKSNSSLFRSFLRKCVGPDSNREDFASLVLWAANPAVTSLFVTSVPQKMRGTGFEPADPYGTAPSTLRRWPGLATHALHLNFSVGE